MLVLSWREAEELLKAKGSVCLSVNLGKEKAEVIAEKDSFLFPNHEHLSLRDAEKIASTKNACFLLTNNEVKKIQFFSHDTNKFYKLYPTSNWPTLEISGIRMHRVTKVTPRQDTEMKISLVSPVSGICLDTCTGLGYTAIALAHSGASKVITVEKDHNCLDIARHNPWSQALFSLAKIRKINLLKGDISKIIKTMKTGSYERIVHDPPSFSLAGELYSIHFYRELYRVMKKRGKMFHYTGRPGAVRAGRDLLNETAKSLRLAGFSVKQHAEALGVVGTK